jgi:hypothetical protein
MAVLKGFQEGSRVPAQCASEAVLKWQQASDTHQLETSARYRQTKHTLQTAQHTMNIRVPEVVWSLMLAKVSRCKQQQQS